MAKEIERKFLTVNDSYRTMASGSVEIAQGYISTDAEATVRIRTKGEKAFLTIKGITRGATRSEWEYEIPADDAVAMLTELNKSGVLQKTRHFVNYHNHLWEIDEFHGRLEGLTVAEVELSEESEPVDFPPFIGEEVTGNPDYYNSNLAAKA